MFFQYPRNSLKSDSSRESFTINCILHSVIIYLHTVLCRINENVTSCLSYENANHCCHLKSFISPLMSEIILAYRNLEFNKISPKKTRKRYFTSFHPFLRKFEPCILDRDQTSDKRSVGINKKSLAENVKFDFFADDSNLYAFGIISSLPKRRSNGSNVSSRQVKCSHLFQIL